MPSHQKKNQKDYHNESSEQRSCQCGIRQVLPSELEVCEGGQAVLELDINVCSRPCIQWQILTAARSAKNDQCAWKDLRRENGTKLSFTAFRNQNGNRYRALIQTKCECWFTNATELKVGYLDLIQAPRSVCFDVGQTAVFTILVDGNPPPTYQWQISTNGGLTWGDLPKKTSNTLSVLMQAGRENDLYRVIVKNRCGMITEQVGFLPPSSLILDNGSVGSVSGGLTQQFLWLNRFTPSSYPFILEEIQVYFGSFGTVQVGDPIDLYVWENKSGNFDPAVGAVFRGSLTGQTVQVLDTFSSYPLSSPIYFDGPGDILIGVVNRLPLTDSRYPGYAPPALDSAVEQNRSWIGFDYPSNIAQNPPTLPAPSWGLINGFGFSGNWMIRGIGCGGSQSPLPNPPPPPIILALAAAPTQPGLISSSVSAVPAVPVNP
jgi:hypothetical protein